MATKELKLAIMGASGVGKSVFLASYFNYTTNRGEGALSIKFLDSESIDYVSEMIQTLFIEHKPLSGTDKRYDMSFRVTSPDCLISLQDIPGGWTTSSKSWEDSAVNIHNDLKNADGVMFFVSVGDLLHSENYDQQNFKDMQAFSQALGLLREPKDKSTPRQDVPVCVVFTKGDLSPETSFEELENRYKAFLKNAQEDGGKFTWFKLGHNVKCWKSVAMGRWEKQDEPPVQGVHQNVIEPMEWLVQRMNSAKSAHAKRWLLLMAIICAFFFLAVVGADHYFWFSAKKDIAKLMEAHRYDEAKEALNRFKNRLLFASILPDFLEAGTNTSDIRVSLQAQSETYKANRLKDTANKHFDELGPYIDGANWSEYPQAEYSYYAEGVNRLQQYLDRTEYYQVTPAKYGKVKDALPYWTVCRELRSVETNTESSELTGDDAFTRLEKLLKSDMEMPSEWRERLNPKVHGLVLVWLGSLSAPDTPEMATGFIGKGTILLHYSTLPQESAQVIEGKMADWKQAESQLWETICNQWLREAADKDPADAIAFLSKKKAEANLSDQFRQTVDNAVQFHWQRRFDRWADTASSNNNPQEAYSFLEKQMSLADLPQNVREKLEEKLRYYEKKIIEAKVADIRKDAATARNLKELADKILPVMATLGNDCPSALPEVNSILENRLGELFQSERVSMENSFGNALNTQDFERAREIMEQGSQKIRSGLEIFQGTKVDIGVFGRQLVEIQKNMLERMEIKEFAAAKQRFYDLKNETRPSSQQINAVINSLKYFMNTYQNSRWNSDIEDVKIFLEKVANGINGTICVQKIECKSWLYGQNEFKVHVIPSNGYKMSTDEREGSQFEWNTEFPIKWTFQTSVKFLLEEQDWKDPDPWLESNISAEGIFGYRKLEGRVLGPGNGQCYLYVTAKIDPPRLPDGWE